MISYWHVYQFDNGFNWKWIRRDDSTQLHLELVPVRFPAYLMPVKTAHFFFVVGISMHLVVHIDNHINTTDVNESNRGHEWYVMFYV